MSSKPKSCPFKDQLEKSRRYSEYVGKLIATDDEDESFESRLKNHQVLVEIGEKLELSIDDTYKIKAIISCTLEGIDMLRQ